MAALSINAFTQRGIKAPLSRHRYSAPGVLAEAAHKTGRAKADFEVREISKEEYERLKSLLQI